MSAQLWDAGIARLSAEERQRYIEQCVQSFAVLIPRSGYIMGKSTPTRIDATAFGYLMAVLSYPEFVALVLTR